MLLFSLPGGSFTVRSAAVLIDPARDTVLLQRTVGGAEWALPGGRCELREPSPATVERELMEELGMPIRQRRLLWVAETFYAINGKQMHEIGFYHLADLSPDSELLSPANPGPYPGREGAEHLEFRWFARASLEQVNLYPVFLRRGLQALPRSPVHVVTEDAETAPLPPTQPAQ